MAEDIVSEVRLEGTEEVVADFNKIGAAGKKAMADVASATGAVNKGIQTVGKTVAAVEAESRKFGASIRNVGSAVGTFTGNVGRIVGTVTKYTAAVVAYVGIAARLSRSQEQQTEDTQEQVAMNRLQEKSLADTQIRALQNEKALRDLHHQLRDGTITYAQYSKAHTSLLRQQREEEEQAQKLELIRSAEAESRIRAEAQIKKDAAARKAYAEAVRAYGADTASALNQFGMAWERFNNLLNQGESFIANIIRGIADLLNTHGAEIVATLDKIGNEFAKLFDDGSGKAQSFGDSLMRVFRSVASAITDIVIPAFRALLNIFRQVAAGINAVFGTDISGEALLIAVVVMQIFGAFKLLYAIVLPLIAALKVLGAVLVALQISPVALALRLAIVAVVALIGYLAALNWQEVADKAKAAVDLVVKAFNAVVDFFKTLGDQIVALWNATWDALTEAAVAAVSAIASGILSLAAPFKKLIGWITDAWNAMKGLNAEISAGEGEGKQGLKRGGPVRGRGSSTSDNVPIWASPGEWVIRAAAAQYYGRRFMGMVNSMRFPRDGFDLSGFASALAPVRPQFAFADGGEVPQPHGRAINLTIGEETFNLITRDDATAERLSRYVASRRIRSSGRKPSSYGA